MSNGTDRERGWASLTAIVLLVTSLTGCIGTIDGPVPDHEATGPNTEEETDLATENTDRLDWWLSACRTVVAIVPVDDAALAEHLPEGFEPASTEEAFGLPSAGRGDGALGVETFACEEGSGLDGSVEDLAYGAVFAAVHPPSDLDHPTADLLLYKWETLVPDDERRQVLVDHGLPAVDGDTDLSGFETTPAGHAFDVSLTLDGATFGFTGVASQANEEFREGFTFLELQEGDDGLGHWLSLDNEARDGNSGTGTLTLDPDHWTRDVVGAPATQAFMVASPGVHFLEGEIQLP